MGRLRSLIALPAVLALLGLGTGCAGGGFWKSKSSQVPPESTAALPGRADASAVIPAGGTSPLASLPASLSWLSGKTDRTPKSGGVTTLVATWQNHIDYLPDPARQGAMGPGLAGQIFVFDQLDQPAVLNGSITVDLYDETARPPGVAHNKPERWKFNKDVLRVMRSVDERFGPNYVLFLPWPTYRPDVTRVRISVIYEPESGSFPIRALESRVTLDPMLAKVASSGAAVVSSSPPQTLPSNLTGSTATTGAPGSTAASSSSGPGLGVVRMGPRSTTAAPAGKSPSGPISPLAP